MKMEKKGGGFVSLDFGNGVKLGEPTFTKKGGSGKSKTKRRYRQKKKNTRRRRR